MSDVAQEILSNHVAPALGHLGLALITPARNEERFIELTLKSVIQQTVRPIRWVIVSDGSTDRTGEIVAKYARKHNWIDYLALPQSGERHFGRKVEAFNRGYRLLEEVQVDIIGNLDADITIDDPEYFAFLIDKLCRDPELGVTGTPFTEDGKTYDYRFTNSAHVSGACQLFRRECFDAIGGYQSLPMGCIDLVAVTTARMTGWKTQSFFEKTSTHHKKSQSFAYMTIPQVFRSGYVDCLIGGDPLWQALRAVNQMRKRPFVFRGIALFAGFFWACIIRAEKPVSKQFVKFRRREQRQRLSQLFRSMWAPKFNRRS